MVTTASTFIRLTTCMDYNFTTIDIIAICKIIIAAQIKWLLVVILFIFIIFYAFVYALMIQYEDSLSPSKYIASYS